MIEKSVIDGIIANQTTRVLVISPLFVELIILVAIVVPGFLQVGNLLIIGMVFSFIIFAGFAGVLAFSYGYLRLWSWLLKFFHND